ncbi:General substrate transporter [Novosphingobium aromaticivorans DSM 12444]|uniref:General substrate transporter n=1 Tax=Novosphingobium aromaticivorans (strain ATCC 700278 / DSM 12444 / CCUG 56034 / CIP 105152 / NBRC 16084 / F199) TaxID=279238 RepID=Q2G514_NOVAD|nr:MFS transporter [Novosphingobium aromaticivorans]ABD27059.1 General substrate transporter [Novosphingobium aromaticivorans DSM 12444]SCY49293.1 Predicted arabinose efflux permease, MFS family [Novosphingobium aromaticivorans]
MSNLEIADDFSALPKHHQATHNEKLIITASSLGTVFEWYDFYLYGLLTAIIAAKFLTGLNPTTSFIMALLVFAAGFIVRPFGALVFGRIGDMVGRRYTFIVTLLVMGLSTFLVGCLPTYETVGVAAPIMLVVLRMFQGLALGGEYGGAATYVAEHAPEGKRGLYTSWIQITATAGLAMALLIVILVRSPVTGVGEEAFKDWGWRVPYLISGLFLCVGLWLRLKLHESPVFQKMKDEGTSSKRPLGEAFGEWKNLKIVLIAFFGAIAGQAVVWYTGQLYAMYFLEKMLKVDGLTANTLIIVALACATPFFLFFGWLSDKIGRKKIILAGCALAALTMFPAFKALTEAANPALAHAQANAPVKVLANPAECSSQFDPVGANKFDTTSCDIVKNALAKAAVNYENVAAPAGTIASIRIGSTTIVAPDPSKVSGDEKKAAIAAFAKQVTSDLETVGYPAKADPDQIDKPVVVAILFYLVLLVTMVYGPIAAMLVELFPSRIRYTSMSLPYHIGNGWLGGLLPAIGFAMVAANGDIYHGFWYPVIVAAATCVIGLVFLPETYKRSIDD